MLGQNIENLVAMYWEGDRSNVKNRYEELFGGAAPEGENSDDTEANPDENGIPDADSVSEPDEVRLINIGDGIDAIPW